MRLVPSQTLPALNWFDYHEENTVQKLGIVALVGAAALGFLTYTEGTLAFHSSAEPEEITLQKLIERGPDGNPYVHVGNFLLCDNMVFQHNKNNKDSWTHVWVPAVPMEEVDLTVPGPLRPNNVKALFFSTKIRNEGELKARLVQPKVQALVTNKITSLDSKIRDMLQQSYGGTDFNKCLIIQEGRSPFSRGAVFALAGGAVVALAAGVGFLIAARGRSAPAGDVHDRYTNDRSRDER